MPEQADREAQKELWLECVKSADKHGNLDKIPVRKATTPREVETARIQQQALSRALFGMPEGYERIFGKKSELVDKAFVDKWFEEVFSDG